MFPLPTTGIQLIILGNFQCPVRVSLNRTQKDYKMVLPISAIPLYLSAGGRWKFRLWLQKTRKIQVLLVKPDLQPSLALPSVSTK